MDNELSATGDPGQLANVVSNKVSAMLAYWDNDLICRYANDAYLLWFGRSKEEMIGKMTLRDLLGPEIYEKNLPYIQGALGGTPQTFEREIPLPSGEGARYSLANYYPNIDGGVVKGFFVHVADITSLKLLENELLRSHELVTEQNKRLLNFANIVTHNLRSYANNLAIMLDMYGTADSAADRERIFNFLREISVNFSSTIANLSEVVDIQNRSDIKTERVILRDYVNMVTDILTVEISSSNALVLNRVPEEIVLNAVPAYLESILLNLVSNAIKYRHPQRSPVIEINARTSPTHVVLTVEDNGQGINLTRYGKDIFGLYKTFHGNVDASGIGLYLVRSQAETMGGTVEVESKEGEGCTFILRFKS